MRGLVNSALRVCLDLSPTAHRRAGLGTYAGELASALHHLEDTADLTLFYNDPAHAHPLPASLSSLPCHTFPLATKPWRLLAAFSQQLNLGLDRWLPECDIFHATEHLLPRLKRCKTVLTVHDLIFALFPEHHLPLNKWFLNRFMPVFVHRADAIITVSESSKRDLIRLYNVPPERITVIYEGVDARFQPNSDPEVSASLRNRYHLPDRFILYVGTIEPRKNLTTLLEAFKQMLVMHSDLKLETLNLKLIIAGRPGWLYQPTFDRIKALGLEDHVHVLGYVPGQDLPALYRAAEVFAFPSLYEGFGLPPLEAMACGTPVVCSNASSLPEVVGDAGILVDSRDVAAWHVALARLLVDVGLREELKQRGLRRAAEFTWQRTARQTLDVYWRLAGIF